MKVDYFRLFIGYSDTTDVSIASREHNADVLFVDVDAVSSQSVATVASALRVLVDEIEMHQATVVRMPDLGVDGTEGGDDLRREICRRLRLDEDSSISVLEHRGRLAPVVFNHAALVPFVEGASLMAELREAEVRSLVEKRSALTTSSSLRFVLPNSLSSASFLTFGSVIQSTRDIEVIVNWILPEIPRSARSVVAGLDTPGLLSVVERLRSRLAEEGTALAQAIVTAGYPFGTGDADGLMPHVGPADAYIYLLSVSRSGNLEGLVASALESIGGERTERLIVTFTQLGSTPSRQPRAAVRRVRFATILPPDEPDPADLAGRPAVQVEPSTFQMVPELEATSTAVPLPPMGLSAAFFRIASESSAVGVECRPHGSVNSVRPRTRLLSFRVFLEELSEGAVTSVASDNDLRDAIRGHLMVGGIADTYDTLVLPDADAMDGAGVANAGRLLKAVGVEASAACDVGSLGAAKSSCERALLFLWGSVTGASVIRSLHALRTKWPEAQVDVVIVHLRAPSVTESDILSRSVAPGRFVAIWQQVIPWRSLYAREASNLVRWREASAFPTGAFAAAVQRRLDLIAPAGENRRWRHRVGSSPGALGTAARQLFWLTPAEQEDSGRGGLFERWMEDDPSVLLAAASGLQDIRTAAGRDVPVRFDVGTALELDLPRRWLAAAIRCADQGELWFGPSVREQEERAGLLCDWLGDSTGSSVVVGELLAADALGKVPTAASAIFRDFASQGSGETLQLLLAHVAWARSRP